MIVPVIITAIILFPFLLYIIFPSEDLIPYTIGLEQLENEDEEADGTSGVQLTQAEKDRRKRKNDELREIIDPFLDKGGALFGGVLLAITLTTLLATNAAGLHPGVWTMTVPAGFIMLCRDMLYDWRRRAQTRDMARKKRTEKAAKMKQREDERRRVAQAKRDAAANASPGGHEQEGSALGLSVDGDGSASDVHGRHGPVQSYFGSNPNTAEEDDYATDDEERMEEEEMTQEEISDQINVNVHPLGRDVSDNTFEGYPSLPDRLHTSPTDLEAEPSPLGPDASVQDRFPGRRSTLDRRQTQDLPSPTTESSLHIPQINESPEDLRRNRTLSAASTIGSIGAHLRIRPHQTGTPPRPPVQHFPSSSSPSPIRTHRELPALDTDAAGSQRDITASPVDDEVFFSSDGDSGSVSLTDDEAWRPSVSSGDKDFTEEAHQMEQLPSAPHPNENVNGHAHPNGVNGHQNGHTAHENGSAVQDAERSPGGPATASHRRSSRRKRRTVYGAWRKVRRYFKETFPTVSAVIGHLPFALLPFAFSMFILVQGLVTKGWVDIFANAWAAWVGKTGTVGAIGGMGFASVLLCNVSHPVDREEGSC